ncbi:helix-turn-helix domain-containing protein [Burkholderia multivorans]|uniref:IclR family transcriptional regulator n=1 Tax=Burkholderia multivorans TaxID=87883 RepID=UPI000CFE39A7|nr:helix-turn-helix domain-containing protein [Burkholderia multivorans]MBU9312886.1 helix-turn-helix domain-containing protein [Burkholderia multivorans]MCA8251100.1 helix-turn-helix domain-containing protein [Burkholderia multivorans]MCA8457801.1 helix-turn-helix domain-containing protein [Burkholderia multivorans]MDN7871968.1 helix-turn-helix domain-containing protein [Burkholderia multivorans]PRE10870.1 IclR family transcriptional regulator [Burkholderia multivorans]
MNTRDNTDAEATLGAGQVAALARGLKILQCFASGHPELSLRELTELTGLAKPTATRLINTLCEFHLLRYSSRTSRYVLGTEAIALSAPALARMTIRHIARAPMQALARYCAGQVALLTGDGSSLIYTEIAQADESPMHWVEPGTRLPLHSSAPGYARLLTMSREDRERYLRHVRLAKPASVDHLMHRLSDAERELDEFGFCMCCGEQHREVHSVAVPLRAPIDGEWYVFNCSIAVFDLHDDQLATDIGPRVRAMARCVEADLGSALATDQADMDVQAG